MILGQTFFTSNIIFGIDKPNGGTIETGSSEVVGLCLSISIQVYDIPS